ncbi:MAG: carboxypeptidase-like regulatory domain-containing protein [Planctomycetota bacterium]|nr:carboxypeptidase-like regulatory domain-containing protein [Planctomycetota bacterium]
MRIKNAWQTAAGFLALVGMLLPPRPILAAEPQSAPAAARQSLEVVDVALGRNGLLTGRVLDRRGQGVAGTSVTVVADATAVSQAKTDLAGHFHVTGLASGVHQLVTPNGHQICRLWRAEAAPPSAIPSVQFVTDDKVVAGQYSPVKCWLANPWVMAGLAAVAIGVPVAVHNNRQDRDSGS